jgi:hypothetical protein
VISRSDLKSGAYAARCSICYSRSLFAWALLVGIAVHDGRVRTHDRTGAVLEKRPIRTCWGTPAAMHRPTTGMRHPRFHGFLARDSVELQIKQNTVVFSRKITTCGAYLK